MDRWCAPFCGPRVPPFPPAPTPIDRFSALVEQLQAFQVRHMPILRVHAPGGRSPEPVLLALVRPSYGEDERTG